jgi:hypothetical protein
MLVFANDTISIEKLWLSDGSVVLETHSTTPDATIAIEDIDKVIAGLEFAKSDELIERTKELVATLNELNVRDIIAIDIYSIDSLVKGCVDVDDSNGVRTVEFEVPRLVA